MLESIFRWATECQTVCVTQSSKSLLQRDCPASQNKAWSQVSRGDSKEVFEFACLSFESFFFAWGSVKKLSPSCERKTWERNLCNLFLNRVPQGCRKHPNTSFQKQSFKRILTLHLRPTSNESLFLTTSSEQESKLTMSRQAPVKLSFHLDQGSTLRPALYRTANYCVTTATSELHTHRAFTSLYLPSAFLMLSQATILCH